VTNKCERNGIYIMRRHMRHVAYLQAKLLLISLFSNNQSFIRLLTPALPPIILLSLYYFLLESFFRHCVCSRNLVDSQMTSQPLAVPLHLVVTMTVTFKVSRKHLHTTSKKCRRDEERI